MGTRVGTQSLTPEPEPCCGLQGKKIILVGFPGGSICTEKHIPSYIKLVGLPDTLSAGTRMYRPAVQSTVDLQGPGSRELVTLLSQ